MDKETRDLSIGGALLVLLVILYFAARPAPAVPAPANDENVTSTQPSDVGNIGYNMPPTLTLPPYNAGNSAPITVDMGSHAPTESGGCGCNACGGGQSPTTNFAGMTNFWSDISDNSGIKAPALTTVKLPDIQPITIPDTGTIEPGALNFNDWKAVEGIGTVAGTSFLKASADFAVDATQAYNKLFEVMPGADILKTAPDSQKYAIYKMLHGKQWRDASPRLQQQVLDFIYTSNS